MAPAWQDVAKDKRRQRYSTYPTEWLLSQEYLNNLPEDHNAIESMSELDMWTSLELEYFKADGTALVERIARRDAGYTAMEVTKAHCKRACVADQLLNWWTKAVATIMICLFAYYTALWQHLRTAFRKSHDPRQVSGRLYGKAWQTHWAAARLADVTQGEVAILCQMGLSSSRWCFAAQDQFNIEGIITSLAYVGRAGRVAEYTSPIGTILENAGAIVIAKTTIPTSMMIWETKSNLFGITRNPHDRSLTPSEVAWDEWEVRPCARWQRKTLGL
jgi:hypothetical protein